MGRKRVLSDEGIKLFNMGFDVPAPARGCVKQMLHNLFTSEFDTNIDNSSVQMRKASMKLYVKGLVLPLTGSCENKFFSNLVISKPPLYLAGNFIL